MAAQRRIQATRQPTRKSQGRALPWFLTLVVAGFLRSFFDSPSGSADALLENDARQIPLRPTEPKDGRRQHAITWRDYSHREYRGEFSISSAEYQLGRTNRYALGNHATSIRYDEQCQKYADLDERTSFTWYWLWVYANLVRHDRQLPDLYRTFDELRATLRPDRQQFAEIIVTAIQHVPYQLIHADTCEHVLQQLDTDAYTIEYHKNGFKNDSANGRPCLPEEWYGLQSPIEFLYNLIGDCDTRVVLLFTVLDHYGFDVAILTSERYRHCVLGINLPAQGRHKKYRGKSYYLWETTTQGYAIGQLHPTLVGMKYWAVVLASQT